MAEVMFAGPNQQRISNLWNMELRRIEGSKLTKLAAIIDKGKGWSILLGELTRNQPLNLGLDAINLIEQQPHCGKSPTLALLNHWAITGRRRPTIRSLVGYLKLCELKRAEAYVYESILGLPCPVVEQTPLPMTSPIPENNRLPPSSAYDIDNEFKFDDLEELVNGLETQCLRYSFRAIYESTNGFCHKPYETIKQTGTKIGEGRFSSVFRARSQTESSYPNGGQEIVAAKLLKSECNKKYLANEINLIARVRHDNILELLGIALGESSSNGTLSYICLIYPYMQNGSLLDCLSVGLATGGEGGEGTKVDGAKLLVWHKRIDIAVKVARGISYLHSYREGPIVHRDIKTANIFIDIDLEPKVGDFTLVRQLDAVRPFQTQFSQNIIGTSVYMPPEAFRGDISIKFDVFSFGIVLLELLTGLRPFDEKRDDLLTYIKGKLDDIDDQLAEARSSMGETVGGGGDSLATSQEEAKDRFLGENLDKKAGEWNFTSSKVLFDVALRATEERKKDRPEISTILPLLESVLPQVS